MYLRPVAGNHPCLQTQCFSHRRTFLWKECAVDAEAGTRAGYGDSRRTFPKNSDSGVFSQESKTKRDRQWECR